MMSNWRRESDRQMLRMQEEGGDDCAVENYDRCCCRRTKKRSAEEIAADDEEGVAESATTTTSDADAAADAAAITTTTRIVKKQRLETEEKYKMLLMQQLPSIRVLLVEGDDSTRHIIAALLRKCNYQVAAFSDGLKAWEMLKEKPHTVDLLLAEVDLPSISGITLLSTIMDHETCRNIPVIMMSSNDSINMVFKCMIKGAADFLVKPIRKNELRNLWQHVWRRHNKGNEFSGCGPTLKKSSKEGSAKGSDAESSCTRLETEAKSICRQHATCSNDFSHLRKSTCQRAQEKNQPDGSFLDHENKDEDKPITLGSECMPIKASGKTKDHALEEECSGAVVETADDDVKIMESSNDNRSVNGREGQTYDHDMPPREIIDLIGAFDSQQRVAGYGMRGNTENNNLNDASEEAFRDEGFSCKSSSTPFLDLSLRRYQHNNVDNRERDEHNTINHSDSSPFSLYNSRMPMSPMSRTTNAQADNEEYLGPSMKIIPDNAFETVQHVNRTDTESPRFGAPSQNGIAIKCSPIRVVPVPFAVGDTNLDRNVGYHTVMQPVVYPESLGHFMWSTSESRGQEAIDMNATHNSGMKDLISSHHQPHNLVPHNADISSADHDHGILNVEPRDEPWHVASVTQNIPDSSACQGNASHIDSSASHERISNEGNGDINTTNVSHVTSDLQNQGEKKPADLHRLQREAALIKFRLKRKERCFEKKVRYQSRKKLAEQRPRVKGQFVRHIQSDDASVTGRASCPVEPAAG